MVAEKNRKPTLKWQPKAELSKGWSPISRKVGKPLFSGFHLLKYMCRFRLLVFEGIHHSSGYMFHIRGISSTNGSREATILGERFPGSLVKLPFGDGNKWKF